ncbi:MAG TPA: ABC transporter substrate-binding protein, partial [Acidimicrobiia bacterium]|nr:ABC transporter substrate-binding protein [Acidimicrobiia bacterium]
IDLKLRDAKLSEFQQRIIEACTEKDFMLVGAGDVFDDTGQKNRLACGLPSIAGYFVTANAEAADLAVEPLPNPSTGYPMGDYRFLTNKFPDSGKAVGVITGNVATTESQSAKWIEAAKSLGATIVYNQTYNALGEPTWRPFAEAIKNAGVKGLHYTGEPANLAKLVQAFADINYKLDWLLTEPNNYDPTLLTAGTAADGTYIHSAFYPMLDPEVAKKNPATRDYLDMMDQYNHGGKIALLGAQSMSSWLLFATAVKECGADVTRDCVYAKALEPTKWTAGGLHIPADVKDKKQPDCYALIQVKDAKFSLDTDVKATPGNAPYNCNAANIVPLKANYGTGEKCPNPAYATDPKPSTCANK